jgi:predicted permease
MLTDWMLRLRSLFRRTAVEQDLNEELQFHLDQQLEFYLRQGLTREEARRRVRLEFGGIDQIKEEHRDARGVAVVAHLWRDLWHAVRQVRRAPAFTALAVLCLGLGIGVNTSIFGVLNAVTFRPMAVQDPDRVVVVSRGPDARFSLAAYRGFRERTRTLSGLTATLPSESDLDIDGESQFVAAEAVSGNYAAVLGARAALGQWFTEDADPVAVISHAVWQRRFGLDPNVIGRTVRSESQSYTIVGVARSDFNGIFSPLRTDLWIPIDTRPSLARLQDDPAARPLLMLFGRLAEGSTASQASIELNAIDAQVTADQGLRPEKTVPIVADQVRGIANPDSRRRTQVIAAFLSVVVGLVLLIACVNVGHLLLVRGAVRQREFAVRRALGASRGRLLQQLLAESLVVALAGGICGLIFAHWTNAILQRSLPLVQGFFPIQLDFSFDWRVITYATAISLTTTVLCGLLPAWRASRTSALMASKGDIAAGRPRGRPFGLVAQVVMSFVLLLISGTFIQALVRMQSADPGFAVAGRLYAYTYISTAEIARPDRRQIYSNAMERLRALPGVRAATITSSLPLMPSGSECVSIPNGTRLPVTSAAVEPGYFDTMDIALVAGRDFALREASQDAFSIVINERLARMLWPRSSAVGERVLVGCEESQPATVIGVVRNSAVRSLGETAAPHTYVSFARQKEVGLTAILLETTTPPGGMVQLVRRTLVELGQGMRVYNVQPLSDHLEKSYASIRWQASMLTAFGVLALALAAVGLYGVIAYRVALRTREIGVRMALGAGRRQVFREVVGHGLSIAVVGVLIGEVLTIAAGRVLGSMDADIRPPGSVVLAATGIIWMAVALVASYVPAARAARVNPLVALRYE